MAQDASQSGLGVITRRLFMAGVVGGCAPRECLVLEAIAAERMPHRMVVRGVAKAPFFELRDYGTAKVAGIFERHGIKPVLAENGRFLFAFESLAQRERVWREAGADRAWECFEVREIAVYRCSTPPLPSRLRMPAVHAFDLFVTQALSAP
jgi:hypothetical protein